MSPYCDDVSPDGRTRCPLNLGHVGVHENWYGSWFSGLWFTRMVSRAA
jgi:hypothetical protein